MEIRLIHPDELVGFRRELAAILVDCVEGGASVHFMLPLSMREAEDWWEGAFVPLCAGKGLIWGAFADGVLSGTVQLSLDGPPNQTHKSDVKKLLVHRRARNKGFARALMSALEAEALARGRTLLVLDTQTGGQAEPLYASMGYRRLGVIPGFAYWPDGRPGDATFFWKSLNTSKDRAP